MTRYGVFLRAALPRTLTDRDIAFLRDYGLTTVVDFRSELECVRAPDPLGALDGITYLNKPMFDAAAAGGALRIQPEAAFGWVPHYIRMLEQQKSWMADVLRALAQAEGCALFHCTTGKDRAGLISALLLKLAGASDEDVVADYCVSEVYLRQVYAEMEQASRLCGGDIDSGFYRTEPAAMRAVLVYLTGSCGGAEGYLRSCGLTDAELDTLREKITCTAGAVGV
jgi:protein-tyrosine phosphatase